MTQKYTGRNSLLARLASQVKSKTLAMSILQRRGQMDASGKLTAKGKARDNMTAGERAIDRASKGSKKPKSAYKYDIKTNRATLKGKK